MGILGTLVKSAISVGQKLEAENEAASSLQEKQLNTLLKTAQNTAFGKYYGFENILNSNDLIKTFQKNVPIYTYKKMTHWWEQQQKFPDIS